MEEKRWQNVLNAQQKFQSLRKPGKWPVDQTKPEKECN